MLPDGSACGTASQTTRDVVQSVLLGKSTGQGLIPRALAKQDHALWVTSIPASAGAARTDQPPRAETNVG